MFQALAFPKMFPGGQSKIADIMEFTFRPIGVIHSPFTEKDKTPIQASRSQAIGRVEVYPEFADGLQDIEALSHVYLLYVFHESQGYQLQIRPFLDDREHGIFATRYPYRPNPIGFSVVKLLSRTGNLLTVEGVDMLDGTPLLDIKPYVPDFDQRTGVCVGWYESRSKK
jgi:tRNA (adenine37-N6)-methyltransferase